jgi:hypothetical protein
MPAHSLLTLEASCTALILLHLRANYEYSYVTSPRNTTALLFHCGPSCTVTHEATARSYMFCSQF